MSVPRGTHDDEDSEGRTSQDSPEILDEDPLLEEQPYADLEEHIASPAQEDVPEQDTW